MIKVFPDYYVRYMKTSSSSITLSERYKITLSFPGGNKHDISKSIVYEATG